MSSQPRKPNQTEHEEPMAPPPATAPRESDERGQGDPQGPPGKKEEGE